MSRLLEEFKEYLKEMNQYDHVTGLLQWDMQTTVPKLGQAAHVDALTGLWDREQFKISMLDELYQNGAGTMFMMDVDNFKEVNDHYGHDIGDKVRRSSPYHPRGYPAHF